MPAALIMRYRRGGRQDDVLLGRTEVPAYRRELALGDPYAALLAAVLELRGAVFVQNALIHLLRAERPASPPGIIGGQAALDIVGRMSSEDDPPSRQGPSEARSDGGLEAP